jgi:tryptophanyl-tRNA synthetase
MHTVILKVLNFMITFSYQRMSVRKVHGLFIYRYKLVVAEVIHEKLEPLRRKVQEYMSEPQYIEQVLDQGSERASLIAQQTWQDVKIRVGLELNEDAYKNCQLPKKRAL